MGGRAANAEELIVDDMSDGDFLVCEGDEISPLTILLYVYAGTLST